MHCPTPLHLTNSCCNPILPVQLGGVAELRALVAEQDRAIKLLIQSRGGASSNSDVEMSERSSLIANTQQHAKASSGGDANYHHCHYYCPYKTSLLCLLRMNRYH